MSTRREFIQAVPTAASLAAISQAADAKSLSGAEIARRHRLTPRLPTPNFFEGMLLGNGDIGVCVTVRPDALGLHLGKEDAWDIRVSEDHYQHVVTFKELLAMWRRAGDEARRRGRPDMLFLERNIDFLREYTEKVTASYRKSWPRPWPCGIVWIHWDSRRTRLERQQLDPSNGLLTVELEHDDLRGAVRRLTVLCFVNWTAGHISVSTDSPAPFLSLAYYPNLDDDAGLPPPEIDAASGAKASEFTCFQTFPATAPTDAVPDPPPTDRDSSLSLCGSLAGAWRIEGLRESQEQLRRRGIGSRDTYTSYEGRPRVFFRAAGEQPDRKSVV